MCAVRDGGQHENLKASNVSCTYTHSRSPSPMPPDPQARPKDRVWALHRAREANPRAFC